MFFPSRLRPHFPALATILLLWLALAATARSQTSANLTLASEYAARGMALDTRPALQLRVEHDAESASLAGWYAGGFASPVDIGGRTQGQLLAYAGRATRLSSTLSWDAGVTSTVFLRDRTLDYHEFYGGLTLTRGSIRVFYSPAYYGEGRTAYLDLNGVLPLGDRLHVALHAGLLHPIGAYDGLPAPGNGGDVRIALGTEVAAVSLEAGWQIKTHNYLEGARPASALTASASLRF